jgi:hypothetical protein
MCDGQSIFHESHRERRPSLFDPQRKTVCSTSSFGCPTASTEGAMRPILNYSSPALRQSALSMHSFMRARTPPGFADDDMTAAQIEIDLSRNETGGFVLAAALAPTVVGIDQSEGSRSF